MNWLILIAALAQMPPARVQTRPIERREVAPTLTLVGTAMPMARTVVSSEIPGIVAELPIDMGDAVRAGEVLCRLRRDPRRMALDEATAALQRLEAAHAEAAAMVRKAEFDRNRMEGLWRKAQCSEKEFRDSVAEFDAAMARADSALHAVESQRALVERMRDQLDRTEIRAPFDGRVVAKLTEVGQWLAEGGAVAEMVALRTIRVRVNVPESVARFADIGAPIHVRFDALEGDFVGKLARIADAGDAQARTFPADVDVENASHQIKAGMFARVDFPAAPARPQLIVPKDAVLRRDGRTLIYVVRNGDAGSMAEPTTVSIVAEVDADVAVSGKGLVPGMLVVVRGNERLFGTVPVLPEPMTSPTARAASDSSAPAAAPAAATSRPDGSGGAAQ